MTPADRVAAWADDVAGPPLATPKKVQPLGRFDLQEFIERNGLKIHKEKSLPDGGKLYEIEACPFNSEHTYGSAFITQGADGKLGFKCHHNSCDGKAWKELRALLEPDYQPRGSNGTSDYRPWVNDGKNAPPAEPTIRFKSKSTEELMSLTVTKPSELIEAIMPTPGAVLIVGAKKSGKTILAVQMAIAIAAGERYLWGQCKINQPGPTLVLEQDDPAGGASLQGMLARSPISTKDKPFSWECTRDLVIGPDLLYTLECEIREHGLRYVVLDSYTALRPRRKSGCDIVKDEMEDFRVLDDLGKRLNCTIAVIHHISHGNAGKSWSERAGGTFGVGMAVEALIFIDRFPELGIDATERLVRIEARHGGSSARVLRFRKDTLDYEHVVEGAAAEYWPMLVDLREHFPRQPFSPKDLLLELGLSRAASTRIITRLMSAGVIRKVSYGSYLLAEAV